MEGYEIFYFSTIRGEWDKKAEESHIYAGLTFRIPAKDWPENMEPYLDEQAGALQELVKQLEEDGHKVGRIIERYEAIDVYSTDVLVMFRVPVLEKEDLTILHQKSERLH